MDIEEIIGMRIMKEVGVDLEKDNTETIIEGITEGTVVDLDQGQEYVPIEIESDAINVESMITLQKTVQHQN